MEIFHRQKTDLKEYISLLQDKYGRQKNFPFFLEDVKKSLSFSSTYQDAHFILIKDGEKVLGHIALLLRSGLKDGEAFFGFFDVIDDKAVFQELWRALLDLAGSKGISILKGPVNATAWHQYRVLRQSDNSDFFKTELFSELYYYDFFKDLVPEKETLYHSGYRENFDFLIKVTEPAYRKALDNGLLIKEIETISPDDLRSILEISKVSFKENWGYTDLSFESFGALYSSEKLDSHLSKIYFLKKGKDIIGYLSALIEDRTTLILKTIAVLPEFQGTGLGNALVYKAHKDAKERGYKKVIYALIREDNKIKNFPKDDAVVFRKYSTFEFKI